mmetsp:Transcript_19144/g.47775  ORF Transcript_19144/g.47775 Transcript_19144/m.47775 type:complete len:241 (-) Transcript_19144:4654-5376(-)
MSCAAKGSCCRRHVAMTRNDLSNPAHGSPLTPLSAMSSDLLIWHWVRPRHRRRRFLLKSSTLPASHMFPRGIFAVALTLHSPGNGSNCHLGASCAAPHTTSRMSKMTCELSHSTVTFSLVLATHVGHPVRQLRPYPDSWSAAFCSSYRSGGTHSTTAESAMLLSTAAPPSLTTPKRLRVAGTVHWLWPRHSVLTFSRTDSGSAWSASLREPLVTLRRGRSGCTGLLYLSSVNMHMPGELE